MCFVAGLVWQKQGGGGREVVVGYAMIWELGWREPLFYTSRRAAPVNGNIQCEMWRVFIL